jgi:hypothetical protein
MEELTYNEVWASYLSSHSHLAYKILQATYMSTKPPFPMLMHNIYYATLIARINYMRFKDPIPPADDLTGIAEYYKKFWNTSLGKATPQGAIENYHKFIGKKSKG